MGERGGGGNTIPAQSLAISQIKLFSDKCSYRIKLTCGHTTKQAIMVLKPSMVIYQPDISPPRNTLRYLEHQR